MIKNTVFKINAPATIAQVKDMDFWKNSSLPATLHTFISPTK